MEEDEREDAEDDEEKEEEEVLETSASRRPLDCVRAPVSRTTMADESVLLMLQRFGDLSRRCEKALGDVESCIKACSAAPSAQTAGRVRQLTDACNALTTSCNEMKDVGMSALGQYTSFVQHVMTDQYLQLWGDANLAYPAKATLESVGWEPAGPPPLNPHTLK